MNESYPARAAVSSAAPRRRDRPRPERPAYIPKTH